MFGTRLKALFALFVVVLFACQPPTPPTPNITAIKILSASTSLRAGSSLNVQAVIEGNDLALETGVEWSISQGTGTLSAASGQQVVYLAPSRLLQPSSTFITATSSFDPSKFATLELTVQPVVSQLRLSATSLNLLPNQTSTITATAQGSGNTDLEWKIRSGGGVLDSINALRHEYTAPAVRQTQVTEIEVVSRLDPSLTANLSLLVRPHNQTAT